jgi:hypothetical protein
MQIQQLTEYGSANTTVARQWPRKRHLSAATEAQETIEELLEATFSVLSVPKRHIEDQPTEPQGSWHQDELIGGKPPVVM